MLEEILGARRGGEIATSDGREQLPAILRLEKAHAEVLELGASKATLSGGQEIAQMGSCRERCRLAIGGPGSTLSSAMSAGTTAC